MHVCMRVMLQYVMLRYVMVRYDLRWYFVECAPLLSRIRWLGGLQKAARAQVISIGLPANALDGFEKPPGPK